jgi:hypothetical protein
MDEMLDYGQVVELYGLAGDDPKLSSTVQVHSGFALILTGTLREAVAEVDRWSPLQRASAIILLRDKKNAWTANDIQMIRARPDFIRNGM